MLIICLSVKEHDIHCGSKSYKFKLLGKLVVQHGIRALLSGRLCIRSFLQNIYFPNLWSPHVGLKEADFGWLIVFESVSLHKWV